MVKKLRWLALMLMICLLLHIPVAAVDTLEELPQGLQGRTFIILGDSFTAGYGLEDVQMCWNYLVAETEGMTLLPFSISGSSIGAARRGLYPMVLRCNTLPDDVSPDFVIIQGGSNDFTHGIPMGEDNERNPDTFCGALNLILDTMEEKYPDALLIGFTPWRGDETMNREGQIQQDYTDAMLRLFGARELPCFNAADPVLSGVRMDDKEFRARYCLRITDWYHLNPEGHAMFAPRFAWWLKEVLYHMEPGGQYYDLADASEELCNAAAALSYAMNSGSEHLFYPTKAVTRQDLAVTMYRLSGRPPAFPMDLTDVEKGTEAWFAVCWGMQAGLFSQSDTFDPDQIVTRQVLATVLCRWYTEYWRRPVLSLTGVGSYSDGKLVAPYARTALGWALASGVMEDVDGKLRPQSVVNRSQLALALAALWRLP